MRTLQTKRLIERDDLFLGGRFEQHENNETACKV